jgi:hypothetical protein
MPGNTAFNIEESLGMYLEIFFLAMFLVVLSNFSGINAAEVIRLVLCAIAGFLIGWFLADGYGGGDPPKRLLVVFSSWCGWVTGMLSVIAIRLRERKPPPV